MTGIIIENYRHNISALQEWILFAVIIFLFFDHSLVAQERTSSPAKKKIIEWSAVEPDTEFLRKNYSQMEELPFDGFVFRLTTPQGEQMMWNMWGTKAYSEQEFSHCIKDIQSCHFEKLRTRFLRVNVTPGKVDWFDDAAWEVVQHNFQLAARLAKKTGSTGLLFDTEQYVFRLFDSTAVQAVFPCEKQSLKAQVEKRGREWMQAVNTEFPDITLLLTFAYRAAQPDEEKNFRVGNYDLLAPFLDGMLAVCSEKTRILDGWEYAYGYRDETEFERASNIIRKQALRWSSHPERYSAHFSPAFPLWTDYALKDYGWDLDDFSRNFHTPEQFEQRLRFALNHTDEYVWIYSDRPRWWTKEKLPAAYLQALKNARIPPRLIAD